MRNKNKISKGSSQKHKKINDIKKVRIVKKKYLNEELLKHFYDYLRRYKISVVENSEEADMVISFGGDGTMLVAAKEAAERNIPVMGVNMGTLGYLADISLENTVEILERYRNNEYISDQRSFLEVKWNKDTFYALNELVISKGGLISHLIHVEVYSNDLFVNKYRADGIIVATPTGSTAYSLSAGGSIVHPSLRALTITPLAPQSLTARPIIVDGDEKLTFKVFSRDNDVHLSIDGDECFPIKSEDSVTAVLSSKKVQIIRSGRSDYYGILREKLKWGESVVK